MLKKIFALALATLMIASLSSVAAAATSDDFDAYITHNTEFYVDDEYGKVVKATYDDGQSAPLVLNMGQGFSVEPGQTIYIPIVGSAKDDSKVKSYKVVTDWRVGKLSSNPDIALVKTYEDVDEDGNATGSGVYQYCVKLKLPTASATGSYDLNGTIKVAKSTTKAKDLTEDLYVTLNATIEYRSDDTQGSGDYRVNNSRPVIIFDKDDSDAEITWGEDDSLAMFEVNVGGQSKLNLAMSTVPDDKIIGNYDASINFVNFTHSPSFSRTGTLYLYADEDTYLYEVIDGKVRELTSAEYDEGYSAWTIKTRKLGSYAISDKKLKGSSVSSSSSDVSSSSSSESSSAPASSAPASSSTGSYNPITPSKPNPDTGR